MEKVEITARPAMDAESFRPLIRQKRDQPLSMEAIRESVAALQQTNEFSQVQVSIEPQLSGLRVIFILQPASYVGIISFPEAAKVFSYTRLLQAVNIPEQSPFIEKQMPEAKSALLAFLAASGYFNSSVEIETQRDDPHRIVNLVFHVKLNRHARVGAIRIEGMPDQEAESGRKALRSVWARIKGASLKPGQKYSQARLQKATDYLRNHLVNSGRLAPSLKMAPPKYDAETNRADITFQAVPGPRLDLRVTGARVSKRTLKRLIPIYEENTVDLDLVAEGKRNLVSYFESKGFFDAKVDSQMNREGDTVRVRYDVSRGARHKVARINFDGNHSLDDDQLERLSQVKRGGFLSRGKYSAELLKKSVNAITAAYRNAGYSKVSIDPKVEDFEPEVDVTFVIDEGPRQLVRNLRVVNTRGEPIQPQTRNKALNLGVGKPYSLSAITTGSRSNPGILSGPRISERPVYVVSDS